MKPILLLVHGWGFDASFWSPLRDCLDDVEAIAWDLGYRGKSAFPPPPAGRRVIAVGHSFGLLWLLCRRPVDWHRLVSINGFARFTRRPDFPGGVAPRLLERMVARFADAPAEVFADFMGRCGVDAPPPPILNGGALRDGLEALAHWDGRPATVDLAVAGRADPIAPPSLTEASFAGAPIEWHPGGHLLPQQDPAWCAAWLRTLLD